jgi:pimeloyl-ACP methyl ester carboxylesterase
LITDQSVGKITQFYPYQNNTTMATAATFSVQRFVQQVATQSVLWLMRQGLNLSSFIAQKATGRWAFRVFCTPRGTSPKPKESHILASAKRWELPYQSLLSTSKTLVGYSWNEMGEKTVLLVHGWELHAGRMTPLVEPLVKQGFRVIAFNAPAHGTGADRSSGKWTNGVEYAWAVNQVINAFGTRKQNDKQAQLYGIVAHSIGCLATTYALARYNREGTTKIVFIAPPSRLADFLFAFQAATQFSKRVMATLTAHFEATYQTKVREFDMRHLVRKIDVPLLFIHDKGDSVCSFDYTISVVAEAPNAEFVQTENLGHLAILRSPEVAERIMTFLTDSVRREHSTEQYQSSASAV